jgi:hypothetical protein
VDEAVQLAQDVVRQVLRGARFAVQVDRDLGILEPDFLDELAQVQHRRVDLGAGGELVVVDRQDEGAGAALLLRELRQVAVARGAEDFEAFLDDRVGERAYAQAGGVFGAEVLVDDDDRKRKRSMANSRTAQSESAKCRAVRCGAPARTSSCSKGRESCPRLHSSFERACRGHTHGSFGLRRSGGWRPASPWPRELMHRHLLPADGRARHGAAAVAGAPGFAAAPRS